MKVYGDLKRAQLEALASDPSAGLDGRVWLNTTDGVPKVDVDGTNIKTLATGAPDGTTIEKSSEVWQVVDGGIDTTQLAAGAVTTVKITDANVTRAKLEALGQQLSASSTTFSTASGAYVDVTNLSVTITTTGRPVYIGLISDSNGTQISEVSVTGPTGAGYFYFDSKILRDTTNICEVRLGSAKGATSTSVTSHSVVPSAVNHPDVVGAGTYTYKIQTKSPTGQTVQFKYCKLIAYEL